MAEPDENKDKRLKSLGKFSLSTKLPLVETVSLEGLPKFPTTDITGIFSASLKTDGDNSDQSRVTTITYTEWKIVHSVNNK